MATGRCARKVVDMLRRVEGLEREMREGENINSCGFAEEDKSDSKETRY